MRAPLEEVSPETAEIIAKQAKASGLSVDEYLRSLLPNGKSQENERPLAELLEGLVGVIDSREPFKAPEWTRDAFGEGVIRKLEKQGLKLKGL